MQGSIVAMLDIWKALIPFARVLVIIHAKYIHNHSIYDLVLAICLRVEACRFVEHGVQ
jgi:hypothetical protein